MAQQVNLGDFEQTVLLAILRLGETAYGVSIREEIRACTSRSVALGALYTTLDRLERKELVAAHLGEPTAERGGRAKRFYHLTSMGRESLLRAQTNYRNLLRGSDLLGGANA